MCMYWAWVAKACCVKVVCLYTYMYISNLEHILCPNRPYAYKNAHLYYDILYCIKIHICVDISLCTYIYIHIYNSSKLSRMIQVGPNVIQMEPKPRQCSWNLSNWPRVDLNGAQINPIERGIGSMGTQGLTKHVLPPGLNPIIRNVI